MARKIRIGAQVYSSATGLGYQTLTLSKHLKFDKIMLVDLSSINGMPIHEEWYDYDIKTKGFPTNAECDQFLDGLDVIFVCETPLSYYLFERANQLGIKSILQYNMEFLDHWYKPDLPRPTVFAAPSLWNVPTTNRQLQQDVVHLPLPIDTEGLPERTITEARTFFHICGRPATRDRNGTLDFLNAVDIVKNQIDARYIIYVQSPTTHEGRRMDRDLAARIRTTPFELITDVPNNGDMYSQGDVMVMPRRFGGQSLVVNEAIGAGIPVLMPRCDPNDTWLPEEWLVPVTSKTEDFIAHAPVTIRNIDVPMLANRMIELYRNPEQVFDMHLQAKEIAKALSWDELLPRYRELIESVVKS